MSFHVDEVDSVQFVTSFQNVEREYIDLGLPSGTLWATSNIGADSPNEYGDYYAWGETNTKNDYSWGTYKYCDGTVYSITKYCVDNSYGRVDYKIELEPEDDAATVLWGKDWQMPSWEQMDELINGNYTTITHLERNGTFGRLITSRNNGKSIFIPGSGYRHGSSLHGIDSIGYYWTRTLGASYDGRAMFFQSEKIGEGTWTGGNRLCGRSIRAVRKQD